MASGHVNRANSRTHGCSDQCCRREESPCQQVVYRSQFLDRDNRAHAGKERIKARLIGDLDPDEWDLPLKPKWMRWETYNRYEERFDHYEAVLDDRCAELIAKLRTKNPLKSIGESKLAKRFRLRSYMAPARSTATRGDQRSR
jgi:hypothetical protein